MDWSVIIFPDEVMQYIANNIKSNIRELEGSLNKLIALANLENRAIDIPLAAEALKDIISPDRNRVVTPELIIDIVSDHFNIPVSELKGKKTKCRNRPSQTDHHVSMP